MKEKNKKVSFGFTEQIFEKGVHVCQIYSEEEERHGTLVDFVISGLTTGENVSCFTEKETDNTLSDLFEKNRISYKEVCQSGIFSLSRTNEVYFKDGKFNPERMLALIRGFYKDSISEKRTGARIIGEMTSEIENVPGGSRLLEYESRISLLLREYPVTAVCQYDAREFDGSTIMDILKVHPYMIVCGSIVRNPFHIQPEEYLSDNGIDFLQDI